jgi:hypothetical protein
MIKFLKQLFGFGTTVLPAGSPTTDSSAVAVANSTPVAPYKVEPPVSVAEAATEAAVKSIPTPKKKAPAKKPAQKKEGTPKRGRKPKSAA